jgi:hypothetical protein
VKGLPGALQRTTRVWGYPMLFSALILFGLLLALVSNDPSWRAIAWTALAVPSGFTIARLFRGLF